MINKINKININSIVADKWFVGWVVRGRGRGKTLGFPTINLTMKQFNNAKPCIEWCGETMEKCSNAAAGVYICKVKIKNKIHRGLLHYGPRPTFKNPKTGLEIHVLDFDKEIKKGKKVQFKLLKYLRKIKKFKTKEELIRQIKKDIQKTENGYIENRNTAIY